jgi:hypothetical protein
MSCSTKSQSLDSSQFAQGLRQKGLAVAMSVIGDQLVDAAAEVLISAAPASRVRQRRAGQGQSLRVGVAVDLGTTMAVGERSSVQEGLMVIVAVFAGLESAGHLAHAADPHLRPPSDPARTRPAGRRRSHACRQIPRGAAEESLRRAEGSRKMPHTSGS